MSSKAPKGTWRLFRAFNIDVYVHWLWFVLLAFQLQGKRGYQNIGWGIAEFVGIFVIVTLHEFGHALACKSVGGHVQHIVLWLLGGVAFAQPPRRASAVLWTIAAGPLVNVLLFAPLFFLRQWAIANPELLLGDASRLIDGIYWINIIIFCFNMLPIYPLDGGQIFQSLLWFVLGEGRSLKIAAGLGFVIAVAAGIFAIMNQALWMGMMALFIAWQAWSGYRYARMLRQAGR